MSSERLKMVINFVWNGNFIYVFSSLVLEYRFILNNKFYNCCLEERNIQMNSDLQGADLSSFFSEIEFFYV